MVPGGEVAKSETGRLSDATGSRMGDDDCAAGVVPPADGGHHGPGNRTAQPLAEVPVDGLSAGRMLVSGNGARERGGAGVGAVPAPLRAARGRVLPVPLARRG